MTQEEQICALAELDGWKPPFFKLSQAKVGSPNPGTIFESLPPYLTSYDAILPLVQKQPVRIKHALMQHLTDYETNKCNSCEFVSWFDYTPTQLCEALLRATNKWKD